MSVAAEGLWRAASSDRRLGRYRLRAEIGRGGMGVVFVADYAGASGFRKRVAIKMLRADRSDAAMAESLRREAKTAARLEHPHIGQIYDLPDAGDPYVVMEYVHGESLASVAKATTALPYSLVAWIGVCLADALSYAHADRAGGAGAVVHRDLSPQNIMVSYDGVPKLVDFGIATDPGLPSEDPAGVRGRLPYMSPEQRRGEEVDGRADLYALGIVLYELAVGAHPWQVAGGEADCPPHPGALRPDFPDALWRAISRATEPSRAQRIGTARELLTMLRQCASDTDGHDKRDDLATVMSGLFGERRVEKERILGADLGLAGETEVLDEGVDVSSGTPGPVSPATAPPTPARSSWQRPAIAAVIATGAIAAGIVWWTSGKASSAAPAAAVADAATPRCVLIDPEIATTPKATWAAARLVGLALERAGAAPVHAYRVQDARGWSAASLAEARVVCRDAGADYAIVVRANRDGEIALEHDGGLARGRGRTLVDAVRAALAQLGVEVEGDEFRGLEDAARFDDRATILTLEAREDLLLEDSTDRGKEAIEVLQRDYPSLEDNAIAALVLQWWAGGLDTQSPPPLAEGASKRAQVLRAVIVALAGHEPKRAGELIAEVLEDRRYLDDPLVAYLAGEALIHQGRPAEGVRSLERALDLDPQLSSSIYHVYERRLAAGDFEGVLALAAHWQRIAPDRTNGAEFRAHAALGAGRYEEAVTKFEELLGRDSPTPAPINRARVGLVHSLLLAGRLDEVITLGQEHQLELLETTGATSALIEPLLYATALDIGDDAMLVKWEHAVQQRLTRDAGRPNHWLLRYTMALLDTLVGREGGRQRWVPEPPPPSVPRAYRFAAHRGVLAALDGVDEAGMEKVDPGAQRLAEALDLERAGDADGAILALRAALESSVGGEFDCISAAALARVARSRGRTDEVAEACTRVLRPRVPRTYCIVLRRQCMRPHP